MSDLQGYGRTEKMIDPYNPSAPTAPTWKPTHRDGQCRDVMVLWSDDAGALVVGQRGLRMYLPWAHLTPRPAPTATLTLSFEGREASVEVSAEAMQSWIEVGALTPDMPNVVVHLARAVIDTKGNE